MGKKYTIITYGCQMNKYDSERISGILESQDFEPTDDASQADLILLNTCSIREKSEQKVYSQIGRLRALKAKNPGLRIGVCGCVATRVGEEIIRKAPAVDLVFGTKNISKLPELLGRLEVEGQAISDVEAVPFDWDIDTPILRQGHLKAFVSVSTGCNNDCSFCVVPATRGREVSKPGAAILEEVRDLVEQGFKEVTLLGQNVNSYGRDFSGDSTFPELLRRVARVDGIERVRFTTSHPKDFSPALIEVMAEEEKVCEHLHLPLQSGSDRVLERMARCYTASEYVSKISALRRAIPNVSITTDLIVGFPGETPEDHEATREVLEEVRYDSFFIFKYSLRPATPAAGMPDRIPEEVKKERFDHLVGLQLKISLQKNQEIVGHEQEVLVEGPSAKGPEKLTGRTRTNKVVNFPGPERLIGHLIPVTITRGGVHSLEGRAA